MTKFPQLPMLLLLLSFLGSCGAWLTPAAMLGTCNASCSPNPAFPCIYTPYYPVKFHGDGKFTWRAPWANGSGVE
eukprot:CAMPEP_0172836736 /NCGR_PEP_ID=MMETSP1075-20121228/26687_1 /TAXON_ID=2916 /ORGANISM="Ceratium fusus, Strain PA161109" /LENGTH=74 /DNA_ID=CAMNT_0013680017 /DNA_START=45 /DNA_END=266 /DNA_ORIENTATION=+